MGIPKFYRWISERYPCLSEVVKEHQIPDFDNLYLDMNGIIHMCSHPEDDNPHFRITEQKIFQDIFHYIEVLFRMIKPKEVFFMAIDGVAPRAKMNQQRGRRFRSAREAEELIKRAVKKGETLPSAERFDSNCITPGTEFMVKLQEQLKYFVVNKLSTDPMWQGTRIYLSGHETPGEGEHKIMDFIRSEKSKPGYDSNTRHCLYGLDADLMMLGMTTHEPHFSLLREEVRFGGKKSQKRMTTVEETTFHLLHLSLLREYLAFEFAPVKAKLSFPFDMEKIIDDWVLMGFLVGNDFIPHLPHLHIKDNALPILWRTYMEVLPTLDGYINEGGKLNLPRFEKFLGVLAKFELDKFNDEYADLKYFEGKTGRKKFSSTMPGRRQRGGKGANGLGLTKDFRVLNKLGEEFDISPDLNGDDLEESSDGTSESSDSDSENIFDLEFRQHKRNYYMDKMRFEHVTPGVLEDQAFGYVKAIQWILHYYYDGVPSWSWFYPHHYAPYISDVKNFKDMKLEFDICTPFLPFQQLMAVLPSASKKLLPAAYQDLMTNDNSPVIDFYPPEFETDLNGKQQDWEAVVLIPFIEEVRLLDAMKSVENKLTDSERRRNSHGPCGMYEFTSEQQPTYPSSLPGVFPDIIVNNAKVTYFDYKDFVVPRHRLKKGLCPGVKLDVYFPGFPTMKHLPHTAELKKVGVKVFQQNSRGDNMMVTIKHDPENLDVEKVAHDLIGKTIFVEWPHLYEAKVDNICTESVKYFGVEVSGSKSKSKGSKKNIKIERVDFDEGDQIQWHSQVHGIHDKYYNRLGVIIGDTKILVYAHPMMGRKYICGSHGKISLEKQWTTTAIPFVYQATVQNIASHDPTFHVFDSIHDLFPKHGDVFMIGHPHYGCKGEVLEIDPSQNGRIRVELTVLVEPNMNHISTKYRQHMLHWMPGYQAARCVGISPHLLSRLTGSVYIVKGSKDDSEGRETKVNIGLNLKSNKKNEEVPSYSKKVDGTWMYSNKTVDVLNDYTEHFPDLFEFMGSTESPNACYYESDVFGDSSSPLRDVEEYLKKVPCADVPRVKHGCDLLEEPAVAMIEKEVEKVKANTKKKKTARVQVRPHLLFRPLKNQGTLIPDKTAEYQLFDRVVNVRVGYSVPLGIRGTVIGLMAGEREQDTMYEVVFDESFQGGIDIRSTGHRCYRLPPCALINLTHGQRKESPSSSHPGQQQQQQQQYGRQAWGRDREYNGAEWAGPSRDNYNNGYRDYWDRPQNDFDYRDQGYRGGGYQGRDQESWRTGGGGYQGRDQESWRTGAGGYRGGGSRQTQEWSGQDQGSWRGGPRGNGPQDYEYRGGQRQNAWQEKPQKSLQQKRDSEEEMNVWKQLQSSASKTQGQKQGQSQDQGQTRQVKGQGQAHKKQEPKGSSLQMAAKSLPKNVQPNPNVSKESNLDVKDYDKKGVTATGMKKVSDEFSAMLHSLELSDKRQQQQSVDTLEVPGKRTRVDSGRSDGVQEEQSQEAKEATTALCQLLKIDAAANLDKPADSKNYGRKVSVEELFNEAKRTSTSKSPAIIELLSGGTSQPPAAAPSAPVPGAAPGTVLPPSVPVPGSAPVAVFPPSMPVPGVAPGVGPQGQVFHPGVQQGRPFPQSGPPLPQQQQQQQQQQQGRQNKQPKMSATKEVEEWCKSMRLPPPNFDYAELLQGSMTHYSAQMMLSNGMKFQGSYAKSKEKAAESAATKAMLQLRGMHQGPAPYNMMQPMYGPGGGPGPGGIGSANSAFRPVHPGQQPKVCLTSWITGGPQYAVPHFLPGNPAPGPYGMPPFFHGGYPPQMMPPFMANQGGFPPGQRPGGPIHHGAPSGQPRTQGDPSQRHQDASLHPPMKKDPAEKSPDRTNPFVPMQVTRQQRTPQKPRKSESAEETAKPKPSKSGPPQQQPSENHNKNVNNNNADQSQTVKQISMEKRDQPETARQVSQDKSSQSQGTTPHKKKARSRRLAANFGNMGQ